MFTRWYVEDFYDFESFAEAPDHITHISLKPDKFVLKVPDGLSYYMTEIGIAKKFSYRSEWSEIWVL